MNSSTSSPEQIEANRVNARRSTGPVTEEGKARSSQNARIHGLCSRQIHCADAEEEVIFSSLRTALTGELAPARELELILFETILHAQWNLRRCRMNEANLLGAAPNPFQDADTRAALKTLGADWRTISIGGLSFSHREVYDGARGPQSLHGIALLLERGKRVAVMGHDLSPRQCQIRAQAKARCFPLRR